MKKAAAIPPRLVERLSEDEYRRLILASRQARPDAKQRREFAKLRSRLQKVRRP
jgi:hypothetical protein